VCYVILRQSIESVITTLDNDCNLFEKALLLSAADVHSINNKSYFSKHCLRSRYAKFVASECLMCKPSSVQRRDREPSRIPIKQLSRVMNKNRNIRKFVRHYITKNVPASSRIHCFMVKCGFYHSIHCKYKGKMKKSKMKKFPIKHNVHAVRSDTKILNHNISHNSNNIKLCQEVEIKTGLITIKKPFVVFCNKCLSYVFEAYNSSLRQLMLSGDIEQNPGPYAQVNMIQSSPYTIIKSRLAEQGLRLLDVGGAGDCFFRAVSHQLYNDPSYHVHVRTAGVQYMTNNPERFVESNTESSWLRYLSNMSHQGTWADALIIQAVADALNLTINITESNEGFVPITIISPTTSWDSSVEINIGHLEETHYVSTQRIILQSSSLVVSVESNYDARIPMNELTAMSVYTICVSLIKSCNYWNTTTLNAINEHANLFYNDLLSNNASIIPNVMKIYDAEISIQCKTEYHGQLAQTFSQILREKIVENTQVNTTGFLICFNNLSISCITQVNPYRRVEYFASSINKNGQIKLLQLVWANLDTFIKNLLSCLCQNSCQGNYNVYFLSCSSPVTNNNNLRQKILRKFKSNDQKRLVTKRQNESYSNMEPAKKKLKIQNTIQRYRTMDPKKKIELSKKKAKQYETMDADKKNDFLRNAAKRYREMNDNDKDHARKLKKHMSHDLDHCISVFHKKIKQGPYYICSVCNRLLYKQSVIHLKKHKYINCDIDNVFTNKRSFDDKEYICKTCHSKVIKGKLPCQAVCNDMYVDIVPSELASLEKLEQILISKRILFEKIVVMPKGQQRKIKGAICNVPIECENTCRILPRPPERSGIIMLKLKRKLRFRGHVYFQAVRPQALANALNWLKINNALYENITIDTNNVDNCLTSLNDNESLPDIDPSNPSDVEDDTIPDNDSICEQIQQIAHVDNVDRAGSHTMNDSDTSTICSTNTQPLSNNDQETPNIVTEEEIDDPLNEHRAPTNETCLQSVIPDYPVIIESSNQNHVNNTSLGSEFYSVAPGENKHPVSFIVDKQCEELAFPALFPKGRFGYTVDRKVKLTPTKYFNARLLHHSGRFATNPEYLFFAQFVIEQKKVSDSINIALKKVHGQSVTASQLRNDAQSLQNLICQEQAYLFLRQIPGTPPYWQKFMYEVVAMVKQLGIPTWFMTLSCADLRWPELFHIIAKTRGMNMTDEEVESMSYNEKCSMLNLNPVVVAKHFQYRVETFFKEILLSNSNPIGKIVYYALRIEFQMRGSPHLHALIWTSDCPKLTSDTMDEYITYIDKHVQAYLPNKETDPELHELVSFYQKHTHSKTCRKYKNINCRFNFGQFFAKRTIVAQPLPEELDEDKKVFILNKQKEILTSVKAKINEVLNPSKPNDYKANTTEEEIFNELGITEGEYYSALSVSPDADFDLHLKRPLDSCFINNYFIAGIKGFRANVDLQPVFNHYKCITYVCSYFTKDETECSQAIMNAAKEAKNANMTVKEGLKKIGAAFLSTREVSSQESAYRCMPELWLRKIFPGTVFVSTDLPDKRIRVAKSKEELDDLDNDSTDIYKSNIIERYSIRPNSIPAVDNLCLGEFAAYYYKDYRKDNSETIDAQPEVLTDDIIEMQHLITNDDKSLPSQIKLINTNEKMKCRKVKAVIRYHTPNKTKEPEKYFHHLLMLYYPWRNETELMGADQTYASKFYEPHVQEIVETNRSVFEPHADAVSEALESLRNNQGNIIHSFDPINDQENSDMQLDVQDDSIPEESFNEQLPSELSSSTDSNQQHASTGLTLHNQPNEISDDTLREFVRSLNTKQRQAYNIVLSWCRNKIKNMNSLKPQQVDPIYLFVTGGAGAGKSHLIKTIYHTAIKNFRSGSTNPELPTVLLMAPTGVAAININGTTVNTALSIPKETSDTLPLMSDQKRTQIRLSLSELKLIIVDEISMIGNTTLLHIHQRLKEIFGTSNSKLFAGISIIAVGDLYQLPPIRRKPVFDDFKNDSFNVCHPWSVFTMIELTDIMRQKDDQPFAELLNRFRTASQTEADIACIQSRSITPTDSNYPHDALHIWAENKPVDDFNNAKLAQIKLPEYTLNAVDQYPQNVSEQDINRVVSRSRSETGGLDSRIVLKETARVMLTTNIDIADRLINGLMGTVIRIDVNPNTRKPIVIYIKFDDGEAGKNAIAKYPNNYAREHQVVPIEPVLTRIKVRPGKASSPEIQRTQFPLTLAWACTVHKVQGLTMENVVISFDLIKQKSFNYGQVYVALSRSTTLQGIHILGNIEGKHVKANPKVHTEYQRLQNMSLLSTNNSDTTQCTDNILTICLINIRSLRKHSLDVRFDQNIINSDIIAFTETQLLPNDNDTEIRNDLHPFALHRQDHPTDKYSSLAICTKQNIVITHQQYINSINGFKVDVLDSNTQQTLSLLILYRKQSTNYLEYTTNLSHIENDYDIDIVLGDFNVNYFNDNDINPLKSVMNSLNYTQIVQQPTFIFSGTLLDQAYLKLSKFDIARSNVISVYYSDHDMVKLVVKHCYSENQ